MEYHPVVQKIIELLKTQNCWFEIFEHEEVRTSEEAAKTRPGYSLRQGAKAIVAKADDNFVMLVFPADQKFNSKKVKQGLGVKDIRFATPDEISEITDGIQIGGVPPFGNLFGLVVYADPTLFENEKIVFNAGDRKFSLAIKSADYKTLVNPKIISLI